jgi:septum site-determining protein MinD
LVLGVIGIKGGVGKTTFTSNLGSAISSEFKKRVLIIDANFDTPHLGISLGLTEPEVTLHHVLSNQASVFDALYQHPSGVFLLPGSLSPFEVDPLGLKDAVSELRDYFDVILIDSSPSLDNKILGTMIASDKLIVVSSPDYPTLSSTLHAVRIARERETPILGIVINRSRGKRFELTPDEISDASGIPILAVLPDDIKVLESLSMTTPTVLFSPRRKISKEYVRLGANLIGENPRKNSALFKISAKVRDLSSEIKKKISSVKESIRKRKKRKKEVSKYASKKKLKGGKNG